MKYFIENHYFVLVPLLISALTQILKLSIDTIHGNVNLKNIWISYGGMPSAHTAFAVSATTLVGLQEGTSSSLFAVAFIFTILIMRDAISFRNIIGMQGKTLNVLVSKLSNNEQKNLPRFSERLGHSVTEVVVGALWGIAMTYLFYFFL